MSTERVLTGRVLAWAAWDWGSAAWNAVIVTFVFTVYLTSSGFGDKDHTSATLSDGLLIAGLAVALLAPVTGQGSDRSGRGRAWLAANTAVVLLISALLCTVRPEPGMLGYGVTLLALGTVFFEIAQVQYNAMVTAVSSPATVGRVSGLGWGLGYLGGIVLLTVLLVGFIRPQIGWFGVTHTEGLHVRAAMLAATIWFLLFAIPVFIWVRPPPTQSPDPLSRPPHALDSSPAARRSLVRRIVAAYRGLWRTIVDLRRSHPATLRFLIASAVFRDGLVGVFTFGGVIAAGSFGMRSDQVIMFGIAANVVAGVATIIGGLLDDRIGPKAVIVGSLTCMVASGLALFLATGHGPVAFWTLGLAMCVFVGPAQSASRSLLARILPAGREGEIFGLYATTGRAASFLSPAAFSSALWIGARISTGSTGSTAGSVQHWGILGLIAVLAVGLVVLLAVRVPGRDVLSSVQTARSAR